MTHPQTRTPPSRPTARPQAPCSSPNVDDEHATLVGGPHDTHGAAKPANDPVEGGQDVDGEGQRHDR